MDEERMRAHVVMPRALVAEVDALVGQRKRSDFMTEAVREKLARIRRERILRETAGALKDADIPGWETPEAASAWVRAQRRLDEERFERKSDGSQS